MSGDQLASSYLGMIRHDITERLGGDIGDLWADEIHCDMEKGEWMGFGGTVRFLTQPLESSEAPKHSQS